MLSDIYNFIIDILFPIKCIGCNKKDSYLCEECVLDIPNEHGERLENIYYCFNYQHPLIKKAIWDLKYYNKKYASQALGKYLYEYNKEYIYDIYQIYPGQKILVIPVPLHKDREKYRGYNQALQLAKEYIKSSSQDIFELRNDIVEKIKDTGQQARIHNRKKRLKNIQGCFRLKNNIAIKNRNIIIIDDVSTTGGTINEMIKILKKAGANNVIGLTVAH